MTFTTGCKDLDASNPSSRLTFHGDRGVQYASTKVVRALKAREIKQSMSRKGDCWDNAVSGLVFATIDKELVYRCKFAFRETAILKIFEYVEVF